ncbi:family 20 glycosylhydrolase [Alteriqipengyuania lutimaris]|uniref:beta-N-acetylhexosaminidase n=1 Tax=Alteriqipengyuania lutimaris TaxID=1538146 RepID=A0A395LHK6_9SPHN|nr:family 20 glycosylhydrolase [Alteriqipengyuania lutimaris]MBB3034853.1 hexosaminidase [Alteriqipengyuania lutimaris]RDS76312.1 N-acetyl-beta-hexosaminidase [Alteriqipengyuania lutimaris]
MVRFALATLVAIGLGGCTTIAPEAERSSADAIGSALQIIYRVLANREEGGCTIPGSSEKTADACYEAELSILSDRPVDLTGSTIFFSQVDPVAQVGGGGSVRLAHVNGDLHEITLSGPAAAVGPGAPVTIPFVVRGTLLTRAKIMPNYYVVDAKGRAALIESTKEVPATAMGRKALPFLAPLPPDLKRAPEDVTPIETPEVTYRQNVGTRFVAEAVDSGIIPTPLRMGSGGSDRVDLSRGIAPVLSGIAEAEVVAALDRLSDLGLAQSEDGVPLLLTVDPSLKLEAEGYELTTAPEAVTIRASDPAGAFYGLQSLSALITPGAKSIPALRIQDAPRFAFRGQHLDIARNFHGPETIRALIDQMAAYKLNKLHLHLADDEGWRLEIAGLPELTAVGSRRCYDPGETRCLLPQLGSGPDESTSGSGFLTTEDYVDLLRYAAARHVEIIPAIDMPGHARAAVKAMEARYRRLKANGASEEVASEYLLSDPDDRTVYDSIQHYSDNTINVCRPSAYRFVAHVLDHVAEMHAAAGQPLQRFHIGADETAGAWADSPICAAFLARADTPSSPQELAGYFVARVANMVAERGMTPGAWSDGLSHADPARLPSTLQSNIWDTLAWGAARTAKDHADLGWDVVLSIPDALYFDMPYAAHPEEGGYYWAIRSAPTRKLFSLMPENLPATASYWRDRDGQPIEQPVLERPRRRFAGIQGQVWSETIRDRETLGYQLFPRMLALAEKAWHRADWELEDGAGKVDDADLAASMQADWNRFASILSAKELVKLAQAGWSYRLPPPGVMKDGEILRYNAALPGLEIQCDMGSDGQSGWQPAAQCASARGRDVRVRVVGPAGTRSSRIVTVSRTDYP